MVIAMFIGFIVLNYWTHKRNEINIKNYEQRNLRKTQKNQGIT